VVIADQSIAVVDDESPVRIMLERVLRLAGYRVSAFASGEAFLAALSGERPNCAILDVHMPGLSGFEVESQLRAATIRIPLVFITASDDAALDCSALQAGASAFLRKPFSSDALLAAVDTALRGSPT
jgi:FixJ family two-component response regulator